MEGTTAGAARWRIRPWRESDAPALARALDDAAIHANLRDGLPLPYTEADALEFIRAMLAAAPGSVYAFAVEVDGEAAGSIGIYRQQNIHGRTAELGYYLAQAHWGRGIMSAAVRAACEEVFAHSDILRIFAEPFAENAASCRLLEKAGFLLEGTMRKNAVKNGRVLDMRLYARVV